MICPDMILVVKSVETNGRILGLFNKKKKQNEIKIFRFIFPSLKQNKNAFHFLVV